MLNVLKSSLLLLMLIAPGILGAQGVVQLTGISFGSDGTGTIGGYVQALYFLAIGIGAALAVLRLILAGAKYMLTDVVTQKGEAKQDVYAGVVGLLIILAAVLILETINPQLNNLQVFQLEPVQLPAVEQPAGANIVTESARECAEADNCEFIPCSGTGPTACSIERERCASAGRSATETRLNGVRQVTCTDGG